ncbi:calcium/sodium antiporter [Pistricoccus aurantiacus]|uniref:Calcium/sodium antiporter n=1 Tax=Pistricoccus aurantiacus TaxID=1883414 RepID=A0A5B8SXS9_9GAMM|nr:calcium/sodium antiporter [Pistricoccus aurantiacus]QEA39633.1 calcium/sodium antiporter [Pistricoccus aurantiacus]
MSYIAFLAGLGFLLVGAEMLVRGASRLAARFGVSSLIIGLTVVAFGTSSPELAVSIKAAFADQAAIAMGNVVGSNIFNVLFILGLSALVTPLLVAQQLIRFDIPLMVLLSVALFLLALDERLSRLDGLLLASGLIAYLGFLLYQNSRARAREADEDGARTQTDGAWLVNSVLVVAGLLLLVIGSRWLVDSAVAFAGYLGISEQVIGLTIVAAGTSLPEVVTSLVAALRGERDIAIGNVVGSNVFNLLGVLGVTSLLAPSGIDVTPAMVGFDIPVMIAVALICLPICFTGSTISRWEGALLLGYYVAYTLYLILAASQHDTLSGLTQIMLYAVLPLTILFLAISTIKELKRRTG